MSGIDINFGNPGGNDPNSRQNAYPHGKKKPPEDPPSGGSKFLDGLNIDLTGIIRNN